MKKTIVVIPRGGLGNRLRVLDSALSYARNSGRRVVVLWPLTAELNCPYRELFEARTDLQVVGEHRWLARARELVCDVVAPFAGRGIDLYDDRTLPEFIARLNLSGDLPAAVVVVRANGRFYGDRLDPARFVPAPELRERIVAMCTRFPTHTVGVHIRRQDNAQAINHSRFEDFTARMDEHLAARPGTAFFLSTDCLDTERRMRERYGERIVATAKTLDRNARAGVKDALVDLYCLSRTRLVIGSYWSTFSEAAAQLGNIPLEIATGS